MYTENNPHTDNQVEIGMRIKLIAMHDDPDPIPSGTVGVVVSVSQWHETIIGVKWENGRTLNIITGVDDYELLTSREESDDIMDRLKNIGEGKEDMKKVLPIKDIAKKHGVSTSLIKKEIELGTDIEMEHTDDRGTAKKIATHHVEEHHDYYSNEEHGLVASEDELEEEYAGGFVGPFGGSGVIKKDKVYESRIIKVSDLINEVSSTDSTKLRGDGGFDGNAWVGDKKNDGWNFNDKPTFHEDGEIVDILAKLDIDWTDEDLTVLTKESITEGIKKLSEEKDLLDEGKVTDFINKLVKKVIGIDGDDIEKVKQNIEKASEDITSGKYKKDKEARQNLKNVVKDISKLTGQASFFLVPGGGVSLVILKKVIPSLNKKLKLSVQDGKITKTPEEDEEMVDETSTFNSVMGDSGKGMPVGKTFASTGQSSDSGKKPSYEGGTIIQSIPNEGVLTNEINDIKYVKGGKFVKLKDKCVKYRNQDFCSSGNMDNPLILSDKTSDNIDEVSKKMGISKEQIFEMIIKNREKRN